MDNFRFSRKIIHLLKISAGDGVIVRLLASRETNCKESATDFLILLEALQMRLKSLNGIAITSAKLYICGTSVKSTELKRFAGETVQPEARKEMISQKEHTSSGSV